MYTPKTGDSQKITLTLPTQLIADLRERGELTGQSVSQIITEICSLEEMNTLLNIEDFFMRGE